MPTAARPKITLAVTGGIAAYKALDLLRALQTAGYDPHIVLTPSAERFVTSLTFAALTGHKVITSLWDQDSITEAESEAPPPPPGAPSQAASPLEVGMIPPPDQPVLSPPAQTRRDPDEPTASSKPLISPIAQTRTNPDETTTPNLPLSSPIEHIAEAQSTRLLLIAPATANTLARLAHGLADDFLTTMYLATQAPVIIAPAMNVNMWHHPATQANIAILRERGAVVVEPGAGYLACGMTGDGRLADIPTIVHAVTESLAGAQLQPSHGAPGGDLTRETILITAGGTREPIDPVRFIGNRSSGKMGYALAAAALARGARVILITAPSALEAPSAAETTHVITAAEMHAATLAALPQATIVIGAAAVSDFRPIVSAAEKIKRTPGDLLTLTLEPTPDILADAVQHARPGTLVTAFAAETGNHLANARAKLHRKGVDAVILNDVSEPNQGFDADRNAATFLTAANELDLPLQPKTELADTLLTHILNLRT